MSANADPDALFAQALDHHEAGRLAEADALYQRLRTVLPDHPALLRLHGLLKHQRGDTAAAQDLLARLVAQHPEDAQAHRALALVLAESGRPEAALACCQAACRLTPDDPALRLELGRILAQLGRWEAAADEFAAAGQQDHPGTDQALIHLAIALHVLGRGTAALEACRTVLRRRPDLASAWHNLSVILADLGQATAAVRAARCAVALDPQGPDAYTQLGNAWLERGDHAAAQAAYRRALALAPDDPAIGSNHLYALNFDPAVSDAELHAACRSWGARLAARVGPPRRHANRPDPERPLSIGYVSADFGRHPVGFFLAPVLAAHDRSRFRIVLYSGRRREDELTRQLRGDADLWRSILDLDDDALAATIRADGIDILVDLSGHTAGNRLAAFARRPAPVQATWGGLVGTSGLSAIDVLIADPQEIPPELEHHYSERVVRLPHGYVCYAPPDYAPPVTAPPCLTRGHATFGCFNRLAKITRAVAALWARVLHAVPGSRLFLKTRELADPALQVRLLSWFAQDGIDAARLQLAGGSPHPELLASYAEVDIALDPFPYSGGLTTLEALWMGVPVVTLGGTRFCSRHTLSHLTVAGLPELIAPDAEAYVALAATLAGDRERLARLRTHLRPALASSPLCDGGCFTRALEAIYRDFWRAWCGTQQDLVV